MTKSNKELAVDLALKYIEATGTQGKSLISLANLITVLKSTYQTLEELDKTESTK